MKLLLDMKSSSAVSDDSGRRLVSDFLISCEAATGTANRGEGVDAKKVVRTRRLELLDF